MAAKTRINTSHDGDEAMLVFLTKINEINGANPADKLAAVEYKIDKTVQRNLIGNISDNITGTVA
ncbi:Uncharacterised protein [Legionella sainthelensi]|nr:hypothetical protein [Legionella sainthelensi]VEH29980.1 Uncharacterised protein [Legionella sainthelensi]